MFYSCASTVGTDAEFSDLAAGWHCCVAVLQPMHGTRTASVVDASPNWPRSTAPSPAWPQIEQRISSNGSTPPPRRHHHPQQPAAPQSPPPPDTQAPCSHAGSQGHHLNGEVVLAGEAAAASQRVLPFPAGRRTHAVTPSAVIQAPRAPQNLRPVPRHYGHRPSCTPHRLRQPGYGARSNGRSSRRQSGSSGPLPPVRIS